MRDMDPVPFPRLHKAVRWAAKLHKDQDREGDSPLPYITHPLEVLSNLRFIGGVTDEELLCASVLHDVVEECGTSLEKIEKKFGSRVRGLVKEVTRKEPTEEERAGKSEWEVWQLRSTMLLDEIRQMSPDAQRIKLADRLSNVEGAFRAKPRQKLERYLEQTEEILKIIPRKVSPGLWDEIRGRLDRAPKAKAVRKQAAKK